MGVEGEGEKVTCNTVLKLFLMQEVMGEGGGRLVDYLHYCTLIVPICRGGRGLCSGWGGGR